MDQDTILVFDFGGQYCHLIGRRIRENNVYSEIVRHDISLKELNDLKKKLNIKGIILSGGPASIYEKNAPRMERNIVELNIPILGICYGHQLIAYYLNGGVKRAKKKEFGQSFASIDKTDGILRGLEKREQIWMSHGDTVFKLPKEFEVLAHTSNCPVAAFKHKQKQIYGIQWHPEVAHTEKGEVVLRNFIFDICKARSNWNVNDLTRASITEITKEVGDGRAIIALSGGVDSSTTLVLASKALGRNLTAVFVDHGFMREGEPEQIKVIAKRLKINLVVVDARKRFLKRLKGITDPEEKRHIIGKEFINVFEETARKIKADYLIQGTIYPDRIESGKSKMANVIKTHHNVGGLPDRIKFKGLIEPLKELYKDEVRKLALQLGLPESIVARQPFPGPGLAVRIIGEVTEEKLKIAKEADSIVVEELTRADLIELLWQYFAVLTNTMSAGVKGDARSYGYVVAVRAVQSREAMTANFADIPHDVLEKISTRITNEIAEVVRVVYDITNKPPSTIEWE